MSIKKNVLFVGSFKDECKDGGFGGVMFACSSLVQSELSQYYNWILIDSSSVSVPPPNVVIRSLFALKRMSKVIYSLLFKKVDVVLLFLGAGTSFTEKGTMALFGKLLRKKVIIAPISGHLLDEIYKINIKSIFIKWVMQSSDVVVCQSSTWLNIFSEKFPSKETDKYVIIENWVDYRVYASLNSRYSENKRYFLFLGWIDEKKGVFVIIEALKIIDSVLPKDVVFYFAGSGADVDNLTRKIEQYNLLNRVEMLGWVKGAEKLKLLGKTEVVILPSYVEGYPNTLVEGMASGNAVIGSTVGGIPDLLENGRAGLIIKEGNIEELAKAILYFANFPEKVNEFALIGQKRVRDYNDISYAIKQFKKIL